MAHTWTAGNSADLKAFLDTQTGRMLMERLFSALPEVKGDTFEQVAIEGAQIRGYRSCLKEIQSSCGMVKEETKESPFIDSSTN